MHLSTLELIRDINEIKVPQIDSKFLSSIVSRCGKALEEDASAAPGLMHCLSSKKTLVDNFGNTFLHTAAFFNYLNLAHCLLEAGYSVVCRDRYGKTPLELAQKKNNQQMVEMLQSYSTSSSVNSYNHSVTSHSQAKFFKQKEDSIDSKLGCCV